MNGEITAVCEAMVRTTFVAFVLWLFAANFDVTEGLTIGLYVIMEGALLWWRHAK